MLMQTYALDEIKVGIEYFFWRMSAYNPYEQGNDTFGDKRVRIGCKHQLAVFNVALQPHAALATVY